MIIQTETIWTMCPHEFEYVLKKEQDYEKIMIFSNTEIDGS